MSQAVETPYRWRWLAFGAVMTSSVIDLLGSTIVNAKDAVAEAQPVRVAA